MKPVRFPIGAMIAPVLLLSPAARAGLVHRWSFDQAAEAAVDGTVLTDSVSAATATVQGNFARFTGTGLTLRGENGADTTNGNRSATYISSYVDLPNGIISSKTHLTVEIWATPLTARGYMRVFDFGRVAGAGLGGGETGEVIDVFGAGNHLTNATASDSLALSFCIGNSLNAQRVEARLDEGSVAMRDSALATAAGTRYHYVMTFEDGAGTYGSSGGRMTWHRDGTLIATADVAFRLSQIEDVNNWLGRSNWTADFNAHATYDEFRIYDHVLTAAEIAGNLAAGPDRLELPAPPVPDHRWTFTTPAKLEASPGTPFYDETGTRVITLRGNGGSLSGGAVVLPGTTTGNQAAATIAAYLDLPDGIVSESASASFEAWATPLSSKNWQRLFDFGRCVNSHGSGAAPGEILDTSNAPGATTGYDNLSLSFNNAGNLNSQQLEGQHDGTAPRYSFSTAATTAGTRYHYVLVVEDQPTGCQARWYRNGMLQNSDDFPFHLDDMEDVNNWIGRSMYSGDSNAHLSLDELSIYRRAIASEEILASHLAGPDPSIGPPEPPAPLPVPSRRWTFDRATGTAPAGTEFLDDATGEVATVRGNGATTNGSELVLSGSTNGNQNAATISAYLDLPDGIVSSRPNLTFEAWITPLSSKYWQRLFDFGNASLASGAAAEPGEIIDTTTAPGNFTANDNLFLSLNNAGTLGSQRIEAKLGGASMVALNTDLSSATAIGTPYHFAMTVADGTGTSGPAGCLVKWFRDGDLAGTIDLPYRLPDLSDVNNWIGRSMWAADSNSNFELDELRLHDRALSLAELKSSFSAGPAVVFPPPVAANDAATLHRGQKVLLDVLANDSGGPLAGSVEIVSPPAVGTAAVDPAGKILYAHAGSSTGPVTFSYRVGGVGGFSPPATVTLTLTTDLRIAGTGFKLPPAPPETAITVVNAFPGLGFEEALCFASPPGDTARLFICERGGLLKVIPDVTAATPAASVVLDLNAVITTPARTPAESIQGGANGECGLLGLAFHPQFASNGHFYVFYSVVKNGSTGFYQRVSRFTVPPPQIHSPAPAADPASELILLEQYDQGPNHQGGDLHFGDDGYLYISVGDEENPNDFRLNSQRIDKDLFAGLLRIDVDRKPGNHAPNPHAAVPTDNGVARYAVPADNPFIGATSFNGLTVDPAQVRTEFYAVGLRSPWRFSIDRATGEIWVGDVGQGRYEELDLIVKGGNYGWVYREGAHDIDVTNAGWPAKPDPFVSTDPVYEYVHNGMAGDANFKGNSIIGGVVYRGNRISSLSGSYIFGDQVSGHIWALARAGGVPGGEVTVTRIGGQPFLSNFGTDPSNGDVLVSDYFGGRIMRITAATPSNSFPVTLGETGLFADLADLSPAPGLLPYAPNLTFWSDHAVKRRWFAIPDPDRKMTWSRDGNWTFPTGQIWVKHFDLETVRGDPATRKRVETRVLVRNDDGVYGVSYRWNEAGTDATLVEDAGADFAIDITVDGQTSPQSWRIPSRAQCITCHTPLAGHALSFNTRQLNLANTIQGSTGNQLELLADAGYFSNSPEDPDLLPFHVRPDETSYPLEARVRSYLDVNCAYCHQPGGSGTSWDGRHALTLEQTGLILGTASSALDPADKLIVPGAPARSVVLSRVATTHGYTRMPPLATNVLDQAGIDLLTAWIAGELPDRPLYDQWRDGFFAASDPKGDRGADPDGDGVHNHDEYLLGSSPVSGGNPWQARVANGNLTLLRKSHRYYAIETSDSLGNWQPWSIPAIDRAYQATDTFTEIPLPFSQNGKQFFRFRVTEP